MKINNEMYFREDQDWWDDDGDSPHAFLRYVVNPVRFAYFHRILREQLPPPSAPRSLLDVGCAGGFLAEEFARIGIEVTGMDPSPALVKTARAHAEKNSLAVRYLEGYGEKIPLEDGSFDFVACCDVLEHVEDVDRVVAEISRVMKPGGMFFFDTVNRTLRSYVFVIKVAQDWKFTAWEQPRTHVWEKFVTPAELAAVMRKHGLIIRELKGISPGENLAACFRMVRQRARGEISRREMGTALQLRESADTAVQYLGYAQKASA